MQVLTLARKPSAELVYSHILRCIGQSLEHLGLKAFELKCEGDAYLVQGWHKGTAISVGVQRRYSPEDVQKLEAEWLEKRQANSAPSNPLSLSQMLRTAGNYVDFLSGRLVRVEWQYQSDKVQCITIQYESADSETQGTIEEISVHLYKERIKMRSAPLRYYAVEAAT